MTHKIVFVCATNMHCSKGLFSICLILGHKDTNTFTNTQQ